MAKMDNTKMDNTKIVTITRDEARDLVAALEHYIEHLRSQFIGFIGLERRTQIYARITSLEKQMSKWKEYAES